MLPETACELVLLAWLLGATAMKPVVEPAVVDELAELGATLLMLASVRSSGVVCAEGSVLVEAIIG